MMVEKEEAMEEAYPRNAVHISYHSYLYFYCSYSSSQLSPPASHVFLSSDTGGVRRL